VINNPLERRDQRRKFSISENIVVLQRAIEKWNAGNLKGYLELYDQNVVLHGYPLGLPQRLEGGEHLKLHERHFLVL